MTRSTNLTARLCAAILAAMFSVVSAAEAEIAEGLTGAELLPGWRTEASTRMAALKLALAPGWKTYWRAPGDTGIPPQFDWSGSQNVASVRIHWPTPQVIDTGGIRQIGYHDQLVLPLEVSPRDPALPMQLQVRVDIGVCKDVCVPASAELQAELSGNGASDAAIRTALLSRPDTAAEAGLVAIECAVEPIADGLSLTVRIDMPDQGGEETVIFETADATVWVAQSQSNRNGAILTAATELVAGSGGAFALDRSGVIVTVLGQTGAVEIKGCPHAE